MIITSVAELIAGQTVIAVNPATSVREVALTLTEYDIGAVLVVENGTLLGIFTERDAVTRIVAERRDEDATPVAAVMTPDPTTIGPDCSLVKAVELMANGGFRHLPVVDRTGIVGVLSMRDVPLHYRVLYNNWVSAQAVPAAV